MKFVRVLLAACAALCVLVVAGLSTGCRSNVDKVRNGYLEYNKTTTVGKALEHTFSNGSWKTFTTEKGVRIVEFDGSHPFKEARGIWGSPTSEECSNNLICSALAKKLDADCDSNSDVLKYRNAKTALDLQLSGVEQRIQALSNQISTAPIGDFERVRDDIYRKGGEYESLGQQKEQLKIQIGGLMDPKSACLESAYTQHAEDPIPVIVQFSINSDGTFQYYANDMSWSTEKLLYNMYK